MSAVSQAVVHFELEMRSKSKHDLEMVPPLGEELIRQAIKGRSRREGKDKENDSQSVNRCNGVSNSEQRAIDYLLEE